MKTPKSKSAKAPKTKKEKAAKPTKASKAPRADAKKFNAIDENQKALFLRHLPILEKLKQQAASATGKLRAAYKQAKTEGGFTKKDFDDAFAMQTAEAEKEAKAKIARTLLIAKFVGADMGAQLDLFAEDERVPLVERAYSEGQTASMQNKAAVPPYDPSTEAYRSYMAGFHDHQEKLAKGIQKTKAEQSAEAANGGAPEPEETDIEDVTGKSDIDMPPPPGSPAAKQAAEVTSGVPTTRSEFMKRQADLATKPN